MQDRIITIALLTSLIGTAGTLSSCYRKLERSMDNPDVAAGYQDNSYKRSIVTGRERRDYKDQGASVTPKTMASIEYTISNVYERDFERCLEGEMARMDTRFVAGTFSVEFTIGTNGKVSNAKLLSIDIKERRPAKGKQGRDADQMDECIMTSIAEWEFDPAPEVVYTHTYNGKVGERW